MATIGTSVYTLQDLASRSKDGKLLPVAEVLAETNDILKDMSFIEANGATGHKLAMRSGLPTATWRLLNYGVAQSKSKVTQVTESMGMLEVYAQVDASLASLSGNVAEFRSREDRPFVESMSQTMAATLFYGNTNTDPEKFMGLAPRYNATGGENGGNIINAGGTGSDNASIWLVTWHPAACSGIYPRGSQAGLKIEDKGQVTIEDAANGLYEGYRTHYKWDLGLVVADWRYVVRICNVDISDLTVDASGSSADLIEYMVKAIHKLPSRMGRQVFYVNETVYTYLDLQTLYKSNMNLAYRELPHGEAVLTFRGIPVRKCDQLLSSEAAVS